MGLAIPVAVSGIEENRSSVYVRYVCPYCRHVWDTAYNLSDNELGEQFGDRFISDRERKVSPQGQVAPPFQRALPGCSSPSDVSL